MPCGSVRDHGFMRRIAGLLALTLLLVTAGCGSDGGSAVDSGARSSTTAVSDAGGSTTTESDVEPVGEFGAASVETDNFPYEGRPSGVALLTDVRVAAHSGFDRIVFEFRDGDVPGHRVRYIEAPIREDASGNEVAVEGTAFIEVHMTPASGVDLSKGESYEQTYTGPRRIQGTGALAELVRTGDFEANLTWVAGARSRSGFAVAQLQDPPRLVVDVRR